MTATANRGAKAVAGKRSASMLVSRTLAYLTSLPSGTEGMWAEPSGGLEMALYIVEKRFNDVVLLDPSDEQFIIPFNILSAHSEFERMLLASDLVGVHQEVRQIHVDPVLRRYIVDLVGATRAHADLYLGASPRGSLALFRTAQATALLAGRDYVIPDDVKSLVEPVLAHRVIMNPAARVRNVQSVSVLQEIVQSVPVPGARVPA